MEDSTATLRSKAEYQAERRKTLLHYLYFGSLKELQEYREIARNRGYGDRMFNAWLLQMIANGASGSTYSPEYVAGLERALEQRSAWLDTAREENTAQREELRVLRQQREALLLLVTELDPEVAARFIKELRGTSA